MSRISTQAVSVNSKTTLIHSYVNQSTAVEKGYVFVQDDGTVIMKADDQTTLPLGQNRERYVLSTYIDHTQL